MGWVDFLSRQTVSRVIIVSNSEKHSRIDSAKDGSLGGEKFMSIQREGSNKPGFLVTKRSIN